MDTEEMFRRGQADAEADTLNAFYYRHYFPYRRGYDQMRRQLLRPGVSGYGPRRGLLWAALVLLAFSGAYLGWQRLQPSKATPTPTTVVIVPSTTPVPTRTPVFPSPTPRPTATATPVPVLQKGRTAIVATAGLRARREPTTSARVVANFREGERVTILDGPREADGYTWWQIKGANGTGWSAERSPDGAEWLKLEP